MGENPDNNDAGKTRESSRPIGRYLKYAIGEILLVVFGILIALQINNWNTDRQERKELYGYLRNIKNNLQSDLDLIAEIKEFRVSTKAFSQNFLEVAQKDEITIRDFELVGPGSSNNVFIDVYLKSQKSGFEALKASGYIGKLNGSELERSLNEYYYILDKVSDAEKSLNNTIETMENIAFEQDIRQQMIAINNLEDKEKYLSSHQEEIKKLLNHPSLTGANIRNVSTNDVIKSYERLELLALRIRSEIDRTIQIEN
jgi:hypothetical protein